MYAEVLLPNQTRVIAEIRDHMVALIESLTNNPELRSMAKVLAKEFSVQKFTEGLEAPASDIDVDASARLILKRQMLWLYEHRESFSPLEKRRLEELSRLIAQL